MMAKKTAAKRPAAKRQAAADVRRASADEEERKLNSAFHACFSTPAGRKVLDYLIQSRLHRVISSDCSDAQLRDWEGQRFLVGEIMRRMDHGGRER
jgi:DNA-binding GntR family transcriptional regulator